MTLFFFMCLCVFGAARAPDCDVDAVVGWWVCLFGNGLQDVSVFGHSPKLSVQSCYVNLGQAGHRTAA